MRMDCFVWSGIKRNNDGIMWIEDEKCDCLDTKSCKGCRFYKNKNTVKRRTYRLGSVTITEWLPK